MTKEEKKAQEAALPIEQRNYWHLETRGEKDTWLTKHKANRTEDIIIPMVYPIAGLVAFILGLVFLIFNRLSKNPNAAFYGTMWMVASIIIMAIGVGVIIGMFIWQKREGRGLFINEFKQSTKTKEQLHNEAIKEERAEDSELESDDDLDL